MTTELDNIPVNNKALRGGRIWKFISIYTSFISFTKYELKTYILLKNFSEVTSLLGVTVSFARVACSARSIYVKGTGTEVASIKNTYTGGICTGTANIGDTGGASIEAIGIRSTCIMDICFDNACTGPGTCFGEALIGDTGAASARGAGSISVLKDLGIHLQ